MQSETAAVRVYRAFGGAKAVADLMDLDVGTVYRWNRPLDKRGGGGCVPAKHQGPLLDLAELFGIPLSAEDVIQR